MKHSSYTKILLGIIAFLSTAVCASAQGAGVAKAVEGAAKATTKAASITSVETTVKVTKTAKSTLPIVKKGVAIPLLQESKVMYKGTDEQRALIKQNLTSAVNRTPLISPISLGALEDPAKARMTYEFGQQTAHAQELVNAEVLQMDVLSLWMEHANQLAVSEESVSKVNDFIQGDYLVNKSLKAQLSAALAAQDFKTMFQDLTEYYLLHNTPFTQAAFDYMLRHPHGRILKLRQLLNDPGIADAVKQPVKDFIAKESIPAAEQPALYKALEDLENAHIKAVTDAKQAPVIQEEIAFYKNLVDEMDAFHAQHHRAPMWNTLDKAEQNLYQRYMWVLQLDPSRLYSPVATYYKQLQNFNRIDELGYWTLEETLDMFEKFLYKTGGRYPQSLPHDARLGAVEKDLYNNLAYWRNKRAANVLIKQKELQVLEDIRSAK